VEWIYYAFLPTIGCFIYGILIHEFTIIYPPPPSISSINGGINAVRIEESKWTKDTNVEIVGTVNLTGDRSKECLTREA